MCSPSIRSDGICRVHIYIYISQDKEISFLKQEKPGNLCSGIKRSIILAYCEDVKENWHSMTKIFELLDIGQIPYVIAADLCLINVILGLSGHGGKKVCCYCEAEKGMEAGEIRTFSHLKSCHDSFIEAGGKKENAQKFANCIHPPLLSVQGDPEVLDVVPPPELHLLMGAVNSKLELLRMILP